MRTLSFLMIVSFAASHYAWPQTIRESTEPLAADLIPAVCSITESQTQVDEMPGKSQAPPRQGAMTDKEKADVFAALAESALAQRTHYTETSYKLRISVWAAFGLATWFILSADKWKPGWIECVVGSLITIGIILVVVFIWGRWTYDTTSRWLRVGYYWNSAIEDTVKVKLPEALRPIRGGYVRYSEGPSPNKPLEPWYETPVYVSQALITTFFGLILIGALISKTARGTRSSAPEVFARGSQPPPEAIKQSSVPEKSHG